MPSRSLLVRPSVVVAGLVAVAAALTAGLEQLHHTADRGLLERLFSPPPPFLSGRLTGDLEGPSRRGAPLRELALPGGPAGGTVRGTWVLEWRALAEPDAASLHNLALLRLSEGRLDEAVLAFRSTLALAPADAAVASDLAAAYLTRARLQDRAADLVLALGAAGRAVTSDPTLAPALYNLALARTRLHLERQAAAAWETFLELEPAPEWRAEALRERAELGRPTLDEECRREWPRLERAALRGDAAGVRSLLARCVSPALRRAEEDLLPAWADAATRGDPAAAADRLGVLRQLGSALHEVAGDSLIADGVAGIDAAQAAGERGRLARLAAGYAAYGRGLALFRAQELDRALPDLDAAHRDLRAAASPLAHGADLYAAICAHYGDTPGSAGRLAALRPEVDSRLYPVLAGQTEWMLGTVENNLGRPESALRHFRTASGLLLPSLGPAGSAGVHVLLAETLHRLGETDEAWQERLRALAGVAALGDRQRLHSALYEAAHALVEQGAPALALDFLAELLASDEAWRQPGALVETRLLRGQALALLGRGGEALEAFRAAWTLAGALGSGPLQERIRAELALAEGEELVARDPGRAAGLLSASLDRQLGQGNRFEVPRTLSARARAYRALGDADRAEADLRLALRQHEQVRGGVGDEQLRRTYFERAQDAFDTMIALELDDRRDGEGAFAWAEQSRSRVLLDFVRGGTNVAADPGALPAEAIRARLPPGVALVEYAVLPDRLVAWVLTATRAARPPVEIRLAPGRLAREVQALRTAMERRAGEPEVKNAAAGLFDTLLRPLLSQIPAGAALVFVPDRSLTQVPFAALFDASRGRYLLEDRVVALAPSATLYLAACERLSSFSRAASWSALAVGDPAFDAARYPRLSRLAEAAAEAAEVAARYPGSELLLGAAALRDAVLAAAGRHRLLHFAGHAFLDPVEPGRSHLLVAPDASGEGGAIYASDLAGLRLPGTELVVLSACRTTGGAFEGREVLTGLAAGFLAAGPPVVVASLWNVEDLATRELMRAFHRQLQEAGDPAVALRRAQLELLRAANPVLRSPGAWAGFVAIGGTLPTLFHRKEEG